jgi:hypothetical protein
LIATGHHTLVEILAAAHAHGCDYTPGQRMYRNIRPLDDRELRALGKAGKYPDETAGDPQALTKP